MLRAMTSPGDPSRPSGPLSRRGPRESALIEIAHIGEEVIAGHGRAYDGGGRWSTATTERVIPGVVAVGAADGRIDLGLHLLAGQGPDSVRQMEAMVRMAFLLAARRAGLLEEVGEVDVEIHEPDETPPVAEVD